MESDVQQIVDEVVDVIVIYGIDVIGAVTILIVGWIAAGWIRGAVNRALGRIPNMDETLRPFLSNVVRYFVLAFVIVAVLGQFGVETTSIIAVLGAAGLAIGLALQGTLSNVASGMMLLMLRPFKVGDFIDAGGIAGSVIEIGLMTTQFKTPDGIYIVSPNSTIWSSTITNYSRNSTRRVDIEIGISYDDDIEAGQKVMQDLMDADDRILKDPASETMVVALGDSSVNINMRCWVKNADFWGVKFDLTKAAKTAIEGAGLSIPYPQQDVHMHSVDKAP